MPTLLCFTMLALQLCSCGFIRLQTKHLHEAVSPNLNMLLYEELQLPCKARMHQRY